MLSLMRCLTSFLSNPAVLMPWTLIPLLYSDLYSLIASCVASAPLVGSEGRKPHSVCEEFLIFHMLHVIRYQNQYLWNWE